jgi:hypothetical protein
MSAILQPRGPRTARALTVEYLRAYYGRSIDRFWGRVKRSDGCWEWAGAKSDRGYGCIATKRGSSGRAERTLAHRVAWTLTYGALPAGADLLHSCDNPSCVRPSHLRLGNQRQNNAEMYARGRGWFQVDRKAHGHYATGDEWRAQRGAP